MNEATAAALDDGQLGGGHGKVHVCVVWCIAAPRRFDRSTYLHGKPAGDTAFLLPDLYNTRSYRRLHCHVYIIMCIMIFTTATTPPPPESRDHQDIRTIINNNEIVVFENYPPFRTTTTA